MSDLPRTQALRCFITVAREGTVSRAAASLHLTQPAVSLQLKGLEESTGLQLFNRTPGGFTLTEAGAALLPLAHKAVSASSDFRTTADSLRQSLRGTLRVGTILDPEFDPARTVRARPGHLAKEDRGLPSLRHERRRAGADRQKRTRRRILYRCHARRIPAFGVPSERTIEDGKFQLMPLMRYDYHVIAPAEWSDKVMGKDWADLAGLPWLATPHHSAHRRLLDDVFRPMGALPKRVAFTDQEDAMIDFVESGICLSLARGCVLERIARKRNFVIADKLALTCDLSFACLTARRHEPVISNAFSAMQAVWDLEPANAVPVPIATASRARR